MNVEQRIIEWVEWKQAIPLSTLPSETIEYRLLTVGAACGSGGSPGDGGMSAAYQRMRHALDIDQRARAVNHVYKDMSAGMRTILDLTYVECWPKPVMPERTAADFLGMDRRAYREAKLQMLAWIGGRLNIDPEIRARVEPVVEQGGLE